MKILYVTTVSSTLPFFPEHIKMLQREGHTVEFAAHRNKPLEWEVVDLNCAYHEVCFSRSPLSPSNIRACKELRTVIEEGQFDIVHCHTPNASAVTRLVCRKLRKKGLKVFYTCHGFHFYKGAPLKNWVLFYPVEWLCAHWTDKLLTINQEDYRMAQKHMHAKEVLYVPGVGFDSHRFTDLKTDRSTVRAALGLREDAIALFSVGELNCNKNHRVILRAIAGLNNPRIHYLIAGVGDQKQALETLGKELGISAQLHLLGYRPDVARLYQAMDLFCHPSYREGLPVSVMEAMSSGLPVIASDNRGTRDLCGEMKPNMLVDADDVQGFAEAIDTLIRNPKLREELAEQSKELVKPFDTQSVLEEMRKVYCNEQQIESA